VDNLTIEVGQLHHPLNANRLADSLASQTKWRLFHSTQVYSLNWPVRLRWDTSHPIKGIGSDISAASQTEVGHHVTQLNVLG